MKVFNLLAAAGAILTLSAGAALAAEGCECCKDMAAGAAMICCDDMKTEPAAPSAQVSSFSRRAQGVLREHKRGDPERNAAVVRYDHQFRLSLP